jgi:hypothetical protein
MRNNDGSTEAQAFIKEMEMHERDVAFKQQQEYKEGLRGLIGAGITVLIAIAVFGLIRMFV